MRRFVLFAKSSTGARESGEVGNESIITVCGPVTLEETSIALFGEGLDGGHLE